MSSAETTATFIYEPANELAALKVGDTVEVVSSQGIAVGRYKVRRVESLVITTECGRIWTRSHGEWVSELSGKKVVSWPFPSIRKVTASAARSFVEKSVKEAGHGE